jgi:hypothetical protein
MTLPQFNQLPDASATQSPLNECDGTLWIISPKESVNLCTNPSFETNTDNWAATAPDTIDRVPLPWAGAYAGEWINGSTIYLTYGAVTPFNLVADSNYAFSFYCYEFLANFPTNTGTKIIVEVVSVATSLVTAKTTTLLFGQWRRVELNAYISPSVAGLHTLRISMSQTAQLIIDAVQIEQVLEDGVNILGTVNQGATTYFDGSTTGTINNSQVTSPQYTWQGKAHESASSRSIGAANGGTPINLQNALGFTIIGIIGGDNPAPNNQTVSFNGVDGGSLVDILIPPRQLTMIGRISATSKESLARKISAFLEYFGRDTTAIRQAKYFIFQYKRGRELVGQPLYFSGIVTNTANAPVSNDLAYTVSMTINMLDPFFYGHTESFSLPASDLNQVDSSLSYVPDFTKTSSSTLSSVAQTLYNANGSIRAMVVAPNGEIFIGGDFTQFDGAVNTAYIVKYSPITKTYTGLRPGADALNGSVSALAITPDGVDLWIGGSFTTANGVAANRIVRYTIATGVWSTYGAGAGGGVGGSGSPAVFAIAINRTRKVTSGGGYPYDVYIGGSFVNTAGGTAPFRISKTSSTSNVWQLIGTGNGMNGDVYSLAYNNNLNRLYIGGSFTTSQAGVANAFVGICYINTSTPATTVAFYTGVNVATGGYVYSIYSSDVDNALYIGGSFTSTFAGAALLRAASFNGVVWNQVDFGFSDGIVYDFQPYNNGFLLTGTFTSGGGYSGLFNGTAYYNGQTLAPVPVSGLGKGFYNSIVTPDNALYLGLIRTVNQTIASGQVQKYVYKGTAAAAIVWQIYHNDPTVYDFVLNQIANLTQQTAVSFKQLPITYKEFVQINTATGTIISDMMGNQLRYILGSGITSQRIMPGNNYLMYWYVTTATTASIDIAAFWRKTYYTLFDGVDAT